MLNNFRHFYRTQLCDHSVALVDASVYETAGSEEGKASLLFQDHVQCFNLQSNIWSLGAPVQEARAKAAAVEHDGLLYVSGKGEYPQMKFCRNRHVPRSLIYYLLLAVD